MVSAVQGHFDQIRAIGFGKVRKTGPPLIDIGSAQWIFSEKIEVVPDDHNGPRQKQWIKTAGCIGDDQV